MKYHKSQSVQVSSLVKYECKNITLIDFYMVAVNDLLIIYFMCMKCF